MTIEQIEQLEYNWDGCDALPIPKDIINILKVLLPKLKYEPDIFPTPNGTVQLEYSAGFGNHLNIEIRQDLTMVIFEMFDNRSSIEDVYNYDLTGSKLNTFEYDEDMIISRVNKFMGKI